MKRRNIFTPLLLAVMLILASAVPALAAIPEVSDSYYVADYADVLSADTEKNIIEKNAELEYNCDGAQIVVVTVDFLDGMNIEDYCYKLFNDWQIGSTSNNGVLLLLTIGEENYWCMTGKGLENKLTSGEIDEILWYNLEDYFAAGDYDTGVQVTFDFLCAEINEIYNVSASTGGNDYYGDDYYYEEELTTMDWIIALVIFAIAAIIIITIICVIVGSIKSARRRKTHYDPYVQPRPVVINPRPARRIYIPAPHRRPTHHPRPVRPAYRPTHPGSFGGGFGGPVSRPSSRPASRPSSRPVSRPTSRPSSFGGGGIGRGGGGMSRGGGAGRRGR